MSTEDNTTVMKGGILFEESYQNLPDWEIEMSYYESLKRAGFQCEACGDRVEPREALQWHIRENDFSARNNVIVCKECIKRDEDDWKADVRERRVRQAGPIRGRVMDALWEFSTTTIRLAEHLIVGCLVVLLFALSTEGAWPLIAGVVATYLAHYAIWTHRDPRGHRGTTVAEWKLLAIFSVVGLGYGVIFALHPSWGTFGLYAVGVLGVAVTFGMTVRADFARLVTDIPRMTVGVLRALVIVSVTAAAVGLPFEVSTAGLLTPWQAVVIAPFVVGIGYIVYRTPRDEGPRDWVVDRYDRVTSRLRSWGWAR